MTASEQNEGQPAEQPATPYHDLDAYLALSRLGGLAISPDGSRLVTSVQNLSPDKKKYLTALWELDPTGERPARRLTRSAKGESNAAFLPNGDLLFTSVRPDVEAGPDSKQDDEKPALWLLPVRGGEARPIANRPGGIANVVTAKDAGTFVVESGTMPGTKTAEEDTDRRKARKDADVNAILHQAYPIRYWDHDLGPDEPRLFAADRLEDEASRLSLRDLTPAPGRSLDLSSYELTPDGRTLVSTWTVDLPRADRRPTIVAIDTETGERRVLVDDPLYDLESPVVSPDGRFVVCGRDRRSTTELPPSVGLWLQPLDGSAGRELLPDSELWPYGVAWSPDGRALFFVADQDGRVPVFRLEVESGELTRLASDGAYGNLVVAPDGLSLYAIRAAIDAAPAVVRLGAEAVDQTPTYLRGPVEAAPLPGTLTEVETTAADGARIRAWLVLPSGASAAQKAPLVLWIHGGPLGSWNAWSWRWNPWLMAAKGYAVLLPDPALSTGYGQAFIERGWGTWGDAPYTDLLAITDATLERSDIDSDHVAAMGGSFGGYMANWVAGHTDRFAAIVTHASLWALDTFGFTTDSSNYWQRELTPERALASSPAESIGAITTPMLVIHGDRDYRVPIGEGLRLWYELVHSHTGDPAELPHRFLYYPDENHWILKPQGAKVWYETVLGFLGWHVFGEKWERSSLL